MPGRQTKQTSLPALPACFSVCIYSSSSTLSLSLLHRTWTDRQDISIFGFLFSLSSLSQYRRVQIFSKSKQIAVCLWIRRKTFWRKKNNKMRWIIYDRFSRKLVSNKSQAPLDLGFILARSSIKLFFAEVTVCLANFHWCSLYVVTKALNVREKIERRSVRVPCQKIERRSCFRSLFCERTGVRNPVHYGGTAFISRSWKLAFFW